MLADEGVLLEPIPTAVKSLGFFSYFCARKTAVQCSELAKIIIMHGTVKDNEVERLCKNLTSSSPFVHTTHILEVPIRDVYLYLVQIRMRS